MFGNFNILAGRAILPQGGDDTEFHLIGLSNGLGKSSIIGNKSYYASINKERSVVADPYLHKSTLVL